MQPQWFRVPRRDNERAAMVVELPGGGFRLELALTQAGDPLPIPAVCRTCAKPVVMGLLATRKELPLQRAGQWRCPHCGGMATLPEQLVLIDSGTGERVEAIGPDRVEVRVSAITMAELLRLSQAAQAVRAGREGAEERLGRVLDDAPEPVRRLRDRMRPGEWIALAGVLIALAAYLTPILKDDGQVTEQQLVEVIERLIEQRDDDGGVGEEPPPAVEKTKSTDKQRSKREGLAP